MEEMQKISLRAARVNANLTLKEASQLIGVDESTLVRWEKHPGTVKSKYHNSIEKAYNFPISLINFNG